MQRARSLAAGPNREHLLKQTEPGANARTGETTERAAHSPMKGALANHKTGEIMTVHTLALGQHSGNSQGTGGMRDKRKRPPNRPISRCRPQASRLDGVLGVV
jgi:hypothetical protein